MRAHLSSFAEVLAPQQRLDAYGGSGFLGGLPPDAETEHDGRARVLNEPARIDITVLEPITCNVVARTWSRPDGTWRVPYLDENQPFTVIATDRRRQVNSAIQDWVTPEPMAPVSMGVPWLEIFAPVAASGSAWTAALRVHGGVRLDTLNFSGLPAWVTVAAHDGGATLHGLAGSVGEAVVVASAEYDDEVLVQEFLIKVVPQLSLVSAVRLRVTANAGHASYLSVTELEVRSSVDGPTRCVGGGAFASSAANDSNAAALAFDQNMVNKWTSASRPTVAAPQHLGYVFPRPVEVTEVAIGAPVAGQLDMAPRDFVVEGLVAGQWIALVERTGETGWVGGQFKVYTV